MSMKYRHEFYRTADSSVVCFQPDSAVFSCRQHGLLKEENSSLIAIDVICWLDVHVSNLHEPVGAGEERELITIFYSPQKIVIVIQHRCHHEEKTPKNRLTETLEPHKQNIGAPKLASRYQTHSHLYSSQAVVNLC